MLERSFAEEQAPPDEGGSSDNQEPEYTFEGFTVEFSEKIMLTPLSVRQTVQEKG
jgi:hypothetical protein